MQRLINQLLSFYCFDIDNSISTALCMQLFIFEICYY